MLRLRATPTGRPASSLPSPRRNLYNFVRTPLRVSRPYVLHWALLLIAASLWIAGHRLSMGAALLVASAIKLVLIDIGSLGQFANILTVKGVGR